MSKESEDLKDELSELPKKWKELGIDPDDFCRCSVCHLILPSCAFEEDKEEDVCKCGELN